MDHSEELEQATVRLDQIIWLANELANFDATSETFRDFCEDLPEKPDHPLYASLPCLLPLIDASADAEAVTEALYFGKVRAGFVFQAAHPVKEWMTETSSSYSWGHYHTAWLYAPDLDGVVTASVAWAQAIDSSEKTKQLKQPA